MHLNKLLERERQTVTLFRGDADEVEQFSMDRTDRDALVGSGIYLTTSYDVAKDYTVKGQRDVLYKSDEGEADDPRGFVYRTFIEQFGPKVKPILEEFGWGVASEVNRMSEMFRREISVMIGTGQEARQHPRYNELTNWQSQAREYAEAKMYAAAEPILVDAVRELYDREYKEFKASFKDTRFLRTVLDELVVVPVDKIGHVSRFRVPSFYLERMFKVDEPMPDWMLKFLISQLRKRINNEFDPRKTLIDLRYNDPEQGEMRADNMTDWLKKFKQYGARYAWGDHDVGGQGQNPTLMEFIDGTHIGQSLKHRDQGEMWDDLRTELEDRGYQGLHYLGGNRTGGGNFAGGSPVKHDVYVLWDENDVNKFRVKSKEIGLNGMEQRLFSRFKFAYVIKPYLELLENYVAKAKNMRREVANAAQIDAAVKEWIKSGDLTRRLGKTREADPLS